MKTIITNTQIFHFHKYDLKGHGRSQKVICLSWNLRKFFMTHSFMNYFDKNLCENYYHEYANVLLRTQVLLHLTKKNSVFPSIRLSVFPSLRLYENL